MVDDPLRIIALQDGVFLYGEAVSAGYKDKDIRAKRRSGEWVRVRHGAYCFGDDWAGMSGTERHRIRALAVRRTTPGDFAFSHVTAAVLHGMAVWGVDLTVVHLTRLDGGPARRQRDVRHHVGVLADEDVVVVDGLRVTAPARALVETATVTSIEAGLVTADSGLHLELCTSDEVWEMFDRFDRWPGSRPAQITLRLMDGRAESVGETRSRYMFWRGGVPAPELQWDVYDGAVFLGRTDFVWKKYRLFGEFDGKGKYLRPYRPGQDAGEVVFGEKTREDAIRMSTGYSCVRIIWTDFDRPRATTTGILRMMRSAA